MLEIQKYEKGENNLNIGLNYKYTTNFLRIINDFLNKGSQEVIERL